jgi:hypothetical protein
MKKIDYKKIIKIVLFIIYLGIHIYVMTKHELWRDEAHAWLMAKNLSLKELFVVSRFDGHPILWHLILMPFAKLGAPYISIQIINLLIVTIAAYIFYFKVEMNDIVKTIILFGAPFIYIYNIIARNYGLILLFIVLLAYYYKTRYKRPYLYVLLLCLLINTPTISWGVALSLFFVFEFDAIKEKLLSKKEIIVTILMFILTLGVVSFELYGTTNTDFYKPFQVPFVDNSKFFIILLFASIIIFGISTFFIDKKMFKEFFIFSFGLMWQIGIVLFFYSYILDQRLFYLTIVWLGYIIVFINNSKQSKKLAIAIVFIIFSISFTYKSYTYVVEDISYNFSSSKETAEWINNNINADRILFDRSIYCQALVPYLRNVKAYDVSKNKYFDDLKEYNTKGNDKIDIKQYNGEYIVVSNSDIYENYSKYLKLVYESTASYSADPFEIYYIGYDE